MSQLRAPWCFTTVGRKAEGDDQQSRPLTRATKGPVALAGRIGIDPRCAIYGVRPEICRAFGVGSAHCQVIREAYSIKDKP